MKKELLKAVNKSIDMLNTAAEGYLERIEMLNDEADTIERDAHYENRPLTESQVERLEEITAEVERLEELNDETVEAIESLRVALLKEEPPKPTTEVIYTGGGIWLACKDINEDIYAVVGNDDDDYLNIYDRRGETPYDNERWCCQNLVESLEADDLGKKYRGIYDELKKRLEEESF